MGNQLTKKELNLLGYLTNGELYRLQGQAFNATQADEDIQNVITDLTSLYAKLKQLKDEAVE